MTTEDLRSQIAQIIKPTSEMRDVVRVEVLITLIAAGIALLAMVASILTIPPENYSTTRNLLSQVIPLKYGATSLPAPPIADHPGSIPRFARVFLIGGCGLVFSVPLLAILALFQNLSNKSLRRRSEEAANSILDVWADPAAKPLRVSVSLITKIERVKIDEEKVSRVLACLGTSALDPLIWRKARGSL